MDSGSAWRGRLPVTEYNQEGSIPFGSAKCLSSYNGLEHLTVNQRVIGSSPIWGALLKFFEILKDIDFVWKVSLRGEE
jgi:hypothetical protein